jgi:hypothetical protein
MGASMTESERYIARQTARRVITVACADIRRLGAATGRVEEAESIARPLEDVRDSLIGT